VFLIDTGRPDFVTSTSRCTVVLCINSCALTSDMEIFSFSKDLNYKHEVEVI
jgi:hypothetical protein